MTNRKTTKRALISSLLALLICCTMLVGTTFAWFTDSEFLKGNVIKAGTLDIELGSEAALFSISNKWEPGYSEYAGTTLENIGNLALKYSFSIENLVETDGLYDNVDSDGIANDPADGSRLAEVLEVYVGTTAADMVPANFLGTVADLVDKDTFDIMDDGHLLPGKSAPIAIIIHMSEEAGNEYMNDEISFDIAITATQYTYEADEWGNKQYDAIAPKATQAQINALALALSEAEDGDVIELAAFNYGVIHLGSGAYPYDYPANLTLVGQEGTVFEGFGISDETIAGWTFKNVTFVGNTTDNTGSTNGFGVTTKATIDGLIFDGCTFKNGAYISFINTTGAAFNDVVITDTTFDGKMLGSDGKYAPAILLQGVTNITVDGCSFTDVGYNAIQTNQMKGDVYFTNNTVTKTTDRAVRFANAGANITVTGNTIDTLGDADGELLKISGTSGTVTVENNIWNGKTDAEVSFDGNVVK